MQKSTSSKFAIGFGRFYQLLDELSPKIVFSEPKIDQNPLAGRLVGGRPVSAEPDVKTKIIVSPDLEGVGRKDGDQDMSKWCSKQFLTSSEWFYDPLSEGFNNFSSSYHQKYNFPTRNYSDPTAKITKSTYLEI